MESSVIDLSKYRWETSNEELESAIVLKDNGKYKASINRSYYSIFHALRAVTALDGFDSGKHSGIIAFFNKTYVKTGIFDKTISKLIDTAFRLREKADYQDFFVVSRDQAEEQINKAKEVIKTISPYLQSKW
ncbi:MAG: HEPN domain-containing protein [Lachnospiraceae bacterium]|nr:HEPN domain-containing protein [Lachnospiraceae bacterium]